MLEPWSQNLFLKLFLLLKKEVQTGHIKRAEIKGYPEPLFLMTLIEESIKLTASIVSLVLETKAMHQPLGTNKEEILRIK